MISYSIFPNTNYVSSGNYVTLARGTGVYNILSSTNMTNICAGLPEPINWINQSFIINTATAFNTLNYTVQANTTCNIDLLTVQYEVITPKVVFERVNKSKDIIFKDVSFVNTYANHTHGIDVTNNTWIQNPAMSRGRIVIDKWNTATLSWEEVKSFPIKTQVQVQDLPEFSCQYRARLVIRQIPNCGGTSPIIFEAIGDEFPLAAYYFDFPTSPQIESIISANVNKLFHCVKNNNHYITTEVDNTFDIKIWSPNDTYTYNYQTSVACTLPLENVIYNIIDKSVTGSFINQNRLANHKIDFLGTENVFIDGILTNTLLPYDESINLYIESFKPDFYKPVYQDNCSYQYTIQDITEINNPCLQTKGEVVYQYKDSNNEWVNISSIRPLNTFRTNVCVGGDVEYRLKYKNYYTPTSSPCDISNPQRYLILESEYYTYTFNILEYKPEISLTKNICCYLINSTVNIVPDYIKTNNYRLNDVLDIQWTDSTCNNIVDIYNPNVQAFLENLPNNWCNVTPIPNDNSKLEYFIYKWDNVNKLYLPLTNFNQTFTIPDLISVAVPSLYQTSFVPTEIGTYKIEAKLTNCCTETISSIEINICDSYDVIKKCYLTTEVCKCDIYIIKNLTATTDYRVNIRKYNKDTYILVDDFTLLASENKEYSLQDGIYLIEFYDITTNVKLKTFIEYVYCNIETCYDNYVKLILCNPNDTCDDKICEDTRYKLNKITALYNLLLNMVQKTNKLTVFYKDLDVNNEILNFKSIQTVIDKIHEFCNPCQNKDCQGVENTGKTVNMSFNNCGCK